MQVTSRAFGGSDDLARIQAAASQWTAALGYGCYLHSGDFAHRLYNGMRHYRPSELIRVWETAEGRLIGWGFVYPRWNGYEAAAHPDYRSGSVFHEIVDWAEGETWRWLKREGRADQAVELDVCDADETFIQLLEERGYRPNQHRRILSARALDEEIPDSSLPAGFSVRSVSGPEEADKIVEAQNRSFGWTRTAEDYRQIMRSPAYNPQHEWVVVAPDGRFAAFCMLFVDEVTRTGMVEDVGTHTDFRRLGLAKALLYAGMRYLHTRGMMQILIPHQTMEENEAAVSLYYSVGFRPQHTFVGYTKLSAR